MYQALESRYSNTAIRTAGRSGLRLPAISLGLWHNFGENRSLDTMRDIVRTAFDQGVFHFDLANNYGPPPGSAETAFGQILQKDLGRYRNELVITTKAGYDMWPGPFGEGGSRKYLLSSLDDSLTRMGLDYVDIFYSHRFDPDTPLEETIGALKTAVDSGKALYAGISSYSASRTAEALSIAESIGLKLTVHQPAYSMLNRWIEKPDESGKSVLEVLDDAGVGCVAFSPLAQGLLTDKYLNGIPEGSRASMGTSLRAEHLSPINIERIGHLNDLAQARGQSLAQMALAWVLRDPRVTTALIGASSVDQLNNSLAALEQPDFTEEELAAIDSYAVDGDINLWAARSSNL